MAERQVSPELALITDPVNWDGHQIGVCADAEPFRMPLLGRVGARQARLRLVSTLQNLRRFWAAEILTADEVFDASEHRPGTLLQFREEMLTRVEPHETSDLPDEKHCQPVAPDFGLNLGLNEGIAQRVRKDGINYHNALYWGVVMKTLRGRSTLAGFRTDHVMRDPRPTFYDPTIPVNKLPFLIFGTYEFEPVIELGKVSHQAFPRTGQWKKSAKSANLPFVTWPIRAGVEGGIIAARRARF